MISERTGVETDEISASSFIEDDLNMGALELLELLEEIEEIYEIDLVEMKDDFETVGDIFEQVGDKVE